MDSGRLAIYYVTAVFFLLQCIYLAIKKRKDKNFYHEPAYINLFSAGAGVILLLYDYYRVWGFGTDRDTNIAIILLGILILVLLFVIFRNLSEGKKYTVHNIDKANLETILFQTFEKYELKYKKEENRPLAMDTEIFLEEYDASVKMNQSGGSGKNFQLVFVKFDHVYYFEDIILDIKEGINKSTQASRFRGVSEMALAVGIVLGAFWLGTLHIK